MPFFMVLAKRPISLQKKGPKDRYQESIRAAARQILNDTESLSLQGDLYIRILWFHSQQTSQDVDNIIKPVVDSLKSIVFEDDARISQCLVVRIDVRRGDFALPTRNVPRSV
jgi:Holliday junction resolvase RusA-like endonuclease